MTQSNDMELARIIANLRVIKKALKTDNADSAVIDLFVEQINNLVELSIEE